MTTIQSPDIWHCDGDVLLQCEDTLFRVHLRVLAENCHVFKDMTMMSSAVEEEQSIIPLQDSSSDMAHFLRAMYDVSYFRACPSTEFSAVSAILRLSTKYEAAGLRRRAIAILNSAYPYDHLPSKKDSTARLFPPFNDEFAQILSVAILHDVRSILPALFYAASKRPLPEVLSELQRLPLHRSIVDDACARFIIGRERLREAEIKHVLRFLNPSFMRPKCENRNSDTVRLQLHVPHALFRIADAQPYQDWCSVDPSSVGRSLGLCDPCCAAIEHEITVGLEIVWKGLPGMFGLPDWETLRKQDRWED